MTALMVELPPRSLMDHPLVPTRTPLARPCGHWSEALGRCGAGQTRLYLVGPRCPAHTPAALAGEPEPGAGACCPPARCWCGACA
jgi:hypothetical protein